MEEEEFMGKASIIEEDKYRKITVLLLLLAKLQVNQKIIFKIPKIIGPSFSDSLFRSYYRESRLTNLESLQELVGDIRDLLTVSMSIDPKRKLRLKMDASAALFGLRNLMKTYERDDTFNAEITVIIRDLENLVQLTSE